MRLVPRPPVRRLVLPVLLVALSAACAQTERPTITEERLDEDSAATLMVDADAAAPGATSDDEVTGDRVEMGGRPVAELIPPTALLTGEWLPGEWQPDALDVEAMIAACDSVSTMAPSRNGLTGPITALHDAAGATVVQAIFQLPDSGTEKLSEMKESLDRCDGRAATGGTITVEAAPDTAGTVLTDVGDARLLARLVFRPETGPTQYGDLVAVSVGQLAVAVLTITPTPSADAAWSTLVAVRSSQALATA